MPCPKLLSHFPARRSRRRRADSLGAGRNPVTPNCYDSGCSWSPGVGLVYTRRPGQRPRRPGLPAVPAERPHKLRSAGWGTTGGTPALARLGGGRLLLRGPHLPRVSFRYVFVCNNQEMIPLTRHPSVYSTRVPWMRAAGMSYFLPAKNSFQHLRASKHSALTRYLTARGYTTGLLQARVSGAQGGRRRRRPKGAGRSEAERGGGEVMAAERAVWTRPRGDHRRGRAAHRRPRLRVARATTQRPPQAVTFIRIPSC